MTLLSRLFLTADRDEASTVPLAPLEDVLPAVAAAAPSRYRGIGLRDLGRQMFAHLHDSRQGHWQSRACAELPAPVMTPRRAFQRLMAGDVELLPLRAMANRVSAIGLIPYPPGIPLVMPGERVGPADGPWLAYLSCATVLGRTIPWVWQRGRRRRIARRRVPRLLRARVAPPQTPTLTSPESSAARR